MTPRAFAASFSVSPNLPGVNNVSTSGPAGWVSSFYTFALIIGGILAFGAVVYGGILYAISAGNSSKQSEGRSWIWSALIGLLLLAGAYIILKTINPNLINLQNPGVSTLPQLSTAQFGKTPQLSSITAPNACGGSTPGTCPAGQTCSVISGGFTTDGKFTGTYGCQ
jgi:hypothetical protein